MDLRKPEKSATPTLRAACSPVVDDIEPRPVTDQPMVGASLVLIATTIAQISISLVNARLLARGPDSLISSPSSIIANTQVFQAFVQLLEQADGPGVSSGRFVFGTLLVLAILSTVGWYAVARRMLGPVWGIWCGVLWAIHPLFAFLAQRPTALTLCLICLPISWTLLLWWHYCRRRRVAFLAGLVGGLSLFISLPGGLAFVAAATVLFSTGRLKRRSIQSFPLIWVGFALPLIVVWILVGNSSVANPWASVSSDLTRAIVEDNSAFARAIQLRIGRNGAVPAAESLTLIGRQLLDSPVIGLKWFALRAWQTLYATADGHFERPLFAIQIVFLVPAIWGAVVCLREPLWRWPALAGLILVATYWMAAALAQPLARSVAPIGGMLVLFALVGVADLYERLFGRQLQVTRP